MRLEVQERLDSCSLKISTKGLYSGDVKTYHETLRDAVSECIEQGERLKRWIDKQNNKSKDAGISKPL